MEGQIVGGKYRLVRVLGKGGMGAVWLAEHTTLRNDVAVKLIDSELGKMEQPRARFLREAQLAARIKSAHVVQVHDHGFTDEGQPFIAMECLVGESLRDRLTAKGRLSATDVSRIVSHISRALSRAHEAGLVHRDLKPENIFIATESDDEIVKVLDFGVAKTTDALSDSSIDPTRTGALLGTPFYMSPEQAQGLKTVDFRTDLWALGVVVFECLTGQRPFTAEALGPLIGKIMVGPIPVPSVVAPEARLGRDIDKWMEQALARDPARRFASAKEMSEAFMIASGTTDSFQRPNTPAAAPLPSRPVLASPADALGDTLPADTSPTLPVAPSNPPSAPSRVPWIIAVVALSLVIAALATLLLMRR